MAGFLRNDIDKELLPFHFLFVTLIKTRLLLIDSTDQQLAGINCQKPERKMVEVLLFNMVN